ncbi:unnamed protein product [Pseudo-nitzschia multistriata]|uniref:Uncharacterized protein n=1 Tax=Pseudo-nitzschia multistriata TaxID=183589 RepID=A0A448ZTF9_9STRA|nr:unnamed protein product [Pseudo-nitzschia multistriata]
MKSRICLLNCIDIHIKREKIHEFTLPIIIFKVSVVFVTNQDVINLSTTTLTFPACKPNPICTTDPVRSFNLDFSLPLAASLSGSRKKLSYVRAIHILITDNRALSA